MALMNSNKIEHTKDLCRLSLDINLRRVVGYVCFPITIIQYYFFTEIV